MGNFFFQNRKKAQNIGMLFKIEQKYGVIGKGGLGNIIDNSNIYGWLQDKIAAVESRLAGSFSY